MTPSEIANNALQATLETVQSLMKRCMKLKESDPGTLILSDDSPDAVGFARLDLYLCFDKTNEHLAQAKDLQAVLGSATSFSPQLLSCAAVVR